MTPAQSGKKPTSAQRISFIATPLDICHSGISFGCFGGDLPGVSMR
jgi:hypothetical protein